VLRLDVSKELEAIDKNRDFVCSYCHTSYVGRRDPPASHYLIAGREAIKRKDIMLGLRVSKPFVCFSATALPRSGL